MKKLSFILVLLTFANVNSQDFLKEIKFTATGSENYFKRTDSVSNPLIIVYKEKKISIYKIDLSKTNDSLVLQKLPKVELLNYYTISENIIITAPDWEFDNIDALGFKLFYKIK